MMSLLRNLRIKCLKSFGQEKSDGLQIMLMEQEPHAAETFAAVFAGVDYVSVSQGNLLDAEADALVSPANSFGDMGGGVDKAIDGFYEGQAQPKVMAGIRSQFYGELPVGCAMIFSMSTRRFPYLLVAPTMRIPGRISGSINAYLSMRAALVRALKHNEISNFPIRSIALTGLGTGVGGLTAEDAGEQMRTAMDQIIGERWKEVVHPMVAPYQLKG